LIVAVILAASLIVCGIGLDRIFGKKGLNLMRS
jgi:hypothetical protein